tara:strand:- start:1 stop:207 length:207 start_codon:yes stop_codon:yes gene_type:complete
MDTVQSNAISAAGISVALSEHLLHPHLPVKNFRLLNGSSDRTLVHVQRRSEKSDDRRFNQRKCCAMRE